MASRTVKIDAEKDFERTRGAACAPLPCNYRPREPQRSTLYRIVLLHLETFLARASSGEDSRPLPRYIERTFRAFLACGVLACGFTRLRCTARAATTSCSCRSPASAADSVRPATRAGCTTSRFTSRRASSPAPPIVSGSSRSPSRSAT